MISHVYDQCGQDGFETAFWLSGEKWGDVGGPLEALVAVSALPCEVYLSR